MLQSRYASRQSVTRDEVVNHCPHGVLGSHVEVAGYPIVAKKGALSTRRVRGAGVRYRGTGIARPFSSVRRTYPRRLHRIRDHRVDRFDVHSDTTGGSQLWHP